MSLFITFEGGEGCGKSTQARALQRKFAQLAIPAISIHEPGGTPLGEKIRSLLKQSRPFSISSLSELLLFNASRCQLVADIINPGLRDGKIVICDRYIDSTIAYQHYGRGLELAPVKQINHIASLGLKPDLTFLLDVPPEVGLARKQSNGQDRFEQEDLAFHRRVREGFLQLANAEPQRFVVIDSTLPKSKIAGLVWARVSRVLTL